MIFRRRPPEPPPVISNGSYRRWLRAHRPPFGMFMALGEDDQETLALIGDAYLHELSHGIAADAAESDEDIAHRLAHAYAERSARGEAPRDVPAFADGPRHFQAFARSRQEIRNSARTLFGQPPDPIEETA